MGGAPSGKTGTGTVEIKVTDINDNIPTLEKSEVTNIFESKPDQIKSVIDFVQQERYNSCLCFSRKYYLFHILPASADESIKHLSKKCVKQSQLYLVLLNRLILCLW